MSRNKEPIKKADVIVCGHISVDIIPTFLAAEPSNIHLTPGTLIEVGEAAYCTGGAVSNTGIALHQLGTNVNLIGKVSDDFFGSMTLNLLREVNASLADDIAQVTGETSSYTLVVNPPGIDRIFLHCPGTNDTFSEQDIAWDKVSGARHFHFGYPPLMKSMYADGGDQLSSMLRTAKVKGMSVSLDMAMPGKGTAAFSADWIGILTKCLPYVDVFMPSLEEILMMINHDQYEKYLQRGGDLCEVVPEETIQELADVLLQMGCGMVILKLGASGLYMRSSPQLQLNSINQLTMEIHEEWRNRELWAPCFRTTVIGTTGAGDCTIAGFIQGLLLQLGPEATLTGAVAVGAFSVEHLGATGGIQPWETVQNRIHSGWEQLPIGRPLKGWYWREQEGIWTGPADKQTKNNH
ncbi:carbohydrate kinase family protein [Paenibacillus sinopodophylli]|uniref:carbohydrate kinase family protein n=1 Tax=Paenibacillus sinopodophylli TaxID=1837342 RepID=UPI00110CCA72|nr:carbohydrate kinase family protein [Paenibacillus sinopodophylli]